MSVEFSPKELSVTQVLFQYKYHLGILIFSILSIALMMSILHPQKLNHAKEYNYLYSMVAAIDKGREVSFEKLDKKLKRFPNLKPEFDVHFMQHYISNEEFKKAETLIDGVRDRVPVKNITTDKFTNASLALLEKNFEKACSLSIEVKNDINCQENFPLIFAYNLYRLKFLQDYLGNKKESLVLGTELLDFLNADKQIALLEYGIVKKMLKASMK